MSYCLEGVILFLFYSGNFSCSLQVSSYIVIEKKSIEKTTF